MTVAASNAVVPQRQREAIVACLSNVSKTYGKVTALRDVNLLMRRAEVLALLGPNGAGKTTAVKLLLGLAKPTSGRVSVFGCDPRDPDAHPHVGAMLQVGRAPDTLRVREHIDLFSSYYPHPLPIKAVLQATGLEALADRQFGELSGGQKQRVLFAMAICGDPDLLFLDEPTVGLDVETRRFVWSEIRNLVARGKTILLTTHYLNEADALADRIVVINEGSVITEGTPAQIKARTAGKRIRCVTRLPIDDVRAIEGVIAVQGDREALDIQAREAERVVHELLNRDPQLADLEVSSAGLEDAFLALTHSNDQLSASERS